MNAIFFTSFFTCHPLIFFFLSHRICRKLSLSEAEEKFPPGHTRQTTFEHTWTVHWAYIPTAWFPSHCTFTPRLTSMNHLPWAWTVTMTFLFAPTQPKNLEAFPSQGSRFTQRKFPFSPLSEKCFQGVLSQPSNSPTQMCPFGSSSPSVDGG